MKWNNEFLDVKRTHTDPLADEVIKQLIDSKGKEASRKFFDKLIREIELPIEELPDEIQEFMQNTAELPAWLSQDDLQKSNLFFKDHGPKLLLLLYFKSLPLLYSDVNGAQVLVKTSRLTHQDESMEIFARRIAETGQFLLNVMANDNFHGNGKAINTIRKVRLIHAAIRHFIGKDWDTINLGKPINQEDMALTLMTFSVSLIDGLRQLLIDESDVFFNAYFERWKAIGLLLGVDQDLIPADIDEGRLLLTKILERNSGTSEAGILLTKALVDFSKNAIPGKIFDITPEVLINYFTGSTVTEYLHVNSQPGCFGFAIPALFASIFHLGERLEGNSDRINYIAIKLSNRLIHAMVNYFDKYKNQTFEIPAEFKPYWIPKK